MMSKFSLFLLLILSRVATASVAEPWQDLIPNIPIDQSRLTALARKQGPLGDYFKLKLAESHLKHADPTLAFKQVSPVREPIFSFWKDVIEAEIHLMQSKPHEVLALLKRLPRKPRPEISYGEPGYHNLYKRALIARYLAKKALHEDFKRELTLLDSLFPNQKDVQAIIGSDGSLILPSTMDKIDKLHRLFFAYQHKDIPHLVTVPEILSAKVDQDKKCQALYELGSGLKNISSEGLTSIEAFRGVISLNCPEYYLTRALYGLGHLPVASGLPLDQRKKYLERLYKDFPHSRFADDAIYKLYSIAKESAHPADEDKYFKMLAALKKGDMRSKLFFELAYPLYQGGDYRKAAALFEKAIDAEPTPDESYPQTLYWYARSLERTQSASPARSKQVYRRLVQEFPFSFYAILASRRLGQPLKSPTLPTLSGSPPEKGSDYFALVSEFNHAGIPDAASFVLDLALHHHPEWEKTHAAFVAQKLIESHNYRKAIEIAATHFDCSVYGPTQPLSDPLFAAFYPLAYQDKTKMGYDTSALPQGAIEGIMREESLFQKNAISSAGAMGLMQLMPATARLVRQSLSASQGVTSDITDPASNIILGSLYLRDMKNTFRNQLPLAIMAYNAGPGNVSRWLKNFGHLELDEFIETIPLSETRGYVKRVMRSMQVYGSLYHEPFFEKADYFSFVLAKKENDKNGH